MMKYIAFLLLIPCAAGFLCGGVEYDTGFCCQDIWFEPYYSQLSDGCPQGRFYHVQSGNPAASDSNPGTAAQPLATINRAAQLMQPGDAAIVSGTYRTIPVQSRFTPSINPANSGRSGQPIIFKGVGMPLITSQHSESGTARGGSASTIILSEASNSANDFYRGWYVRIVSGRGQGQSRKIMADFLSPSTVSYYGSSKEASVLIPWDTIPDSSSQYVLTKAGPLIGTLNRQHVVIDGFRIEELDNYAPDTGSVVIWGSDDVTLMNSEVDWPGGSAL
jgi:hypothetical protein